MPKEKTIGVGLVGYAFMGKSHSLGYRDLSAIAPANVPRPRLIAICGRDASRVEEARQRFGWERATTDWQTIIDDPEITLVDNSGPNHLHVEPTIAAARAGKHLYSEKPLGPTAVESLKMWREAETAGVKHMCAFNYRFFPALQLARQLIQSGELGTIYHYRSNFLVSSALDEGRERGWRDVAQTAGAGALGDLGSHHIDVARFLLGSDPVRVSGLSRVVVAQDSAGAPVDTDDLFAAILEFGNGAVGVLEASRVAGGHLVTSRIEVDGSKGSLQFSMQNLNELRVSGSDGAFRTIPVIRRNDPYQDNWFPPGHPLGWVDTFSHEAMHILGAVAGLHEVAPIGATFKDGYYCAEIVDAILRSSKTRSAVDIQYHSHLSQA